VFTLLMLVAPAVMTFASGLVQADAHAHMHGPDHTMAMDSQGLDDAGHDKLICSVVIPCEHGFCAGLALLPVEAPGVLIKGAWISDIPQPGHPASPRSLSPPPRRHS